MKYVFLVARFVLGAILSVVGVSRFTGILPHPKD